MMSIVLLTCGADSHRSHCHKIAVRSHAHNADTALLHAFHRGHKPVQGHRGSLWICRMHTDRFVTGSVRFYCKGQRGGCRCTSRTSFPHLSFLPVDLVWSLPPPLIRVRDLVRDFRHRPGGHLIITLIVKTERDQGVDESGKCRYIIQGRENGALHPHIQL